MKKNDEYLMGECDVVVVGAGHAGCEAALAAARMGMNTIMFAIDLESIDMMPCNPAIRDRKSTRLTPVTDQSRMPSSA